MDCVGPIVEFGSGYGTFTLALAGLVTGPIIGLDIEPDLVRDLNTKSHNLGLPNIQIIERDFVEQGTGLPDDQAGHAMLYNILHIENPVGLLKEAWRILGPEGSLSLIHWRNDIPTPRGPSLAIRPTPEDCARWAVEAGFAEPTLIDLASVAPYHFGMRLRKACVQAKDTWRST